MSPASGTALTWRDVLRMASEGVPRAEQRVEKTEEEWRRQLTADEFRVMRQAGTERAFSSSLCALFEPGIYACRCCGTILFDASQKFDSGTGWPSFTQPSQPNRIAYHRDDSHGMTRIETVCNSCDAHLGHVFPDGPPPGGLRYCINALALQKIPAG